MLNKILNILKNYPDDECYQINDRIYKNRDLYKYVCNIYHFLLENNKEKSSIVVYGHKNIYMIASFLACSFAGMTYIPIDISIPIERKNEIINQIKPKIIIDESIEKIMQQEYYKEIDEIYLKDDDIYYIIFTSGSTGKPKGVKITYKNIKSCMKWLEEICNINHGVILNQAIYSFDLSVADIYLSLLTRSKHFILDYNTQKDYKKLFEEIKKSNASLSVMTPSFAEFLLLDKSFDSNLLPNLEKILFCGEKLNTNTVSKLHNRFKNLKIINSYGPTECTFAVTSTEIYNENEISIGVPKRDVEIHIVDQNINEIKDGEIGEIVISGESVGDGYVDESLNENVFINYNNKKSYLTGDLGYKKNGMLYYVGRKDSQIKYKGYRIELGEIEKVLNKFEFVERAVVTTKKDENGKINRIIAFVILKNDSNIGVNEIKQKIKLVLPDYMVPTIKLVDEFPMNSNGKVDVKNLMEQI